MGLFTHAVAGTALIVIGALESLATATKSLKKIRSSESPPPNIDGPAQRSTPSFSSTATPKPVLTLLDLAFPLAASDLGADNLENEFMMNNMHLSRIQRSIEERVAYGLDTTSLDDEAFNCETSLDRCILRLIASCCNSDKLIRATELVKILSLEKSVRGAIKLVTALKLPNLAERFNDILEEKLLSEREGNVAFPDVKSKCNSAFKPEVASTKFFTTPEINRPTEGAIASPSISNLRSRNAEEQTKDRNGRKQKYDTRPKD